MTVTASGIRTSSPLLHRLAGASFRKVRARGAVILAFHQINPQKFESWMRLLCQYFEFASLDELVRRRLNGESMAGLLALTFDDGWADTCEPVAEICHREGWPVTMYIVSRSCVRGASLWFAELPALLDAAKGRRVEAGGWALDLTTPRRERESLARVTWQLKMLPGSEALRVVGALRIAAGLDPFEPQPAFVGADFVRRYGDSPWVKFGSHTADHQAPAALPESHIRAQFAESRSVLEQLCGHEVRHFAYPYGAPNEFGGAAPQIVGRYYDSAVTMISGVCAGTTDLARMPRVPLYDSDGEARMIAKIALAPWTPTALASRD